MPQRNATLLTDDQLFAEWKAWIERSKQELLELGASRQTFDLVRNIVSGNPRLKETGGHVLDWIFGNYAVAAGMTFRRELDTQSGTMSLLQLLSEVEARPQVLTRARYRAEWGAASGPGPDWAFDQLAPVRVPDNPGSDHFDPAVARADRELLQSATESVHSFVQQTFAHRSRGTPDPVTWGQFHEALDVLEGVFRKYYAVLTQSALVTTRPVPQFDTSECFTFPWIVADTTDE